MSMHRSRSLQRMPRHSLWKLRDIDGQHPIKSRYLLIFFFGSWSSHMDPAQFATLIPAPICQLPHRRMQRQNLNIVTDLIHLGPA